MGDRELYVAETLDREVLPSRTAGGSGHAGWPLAVAKLSSP